VGDGGARRHLHLVPRLVLGLAPAVRRAQPRPPAPRGDARASGVLRREPRAAAHALTTNTSSVRGPCTPSTRSSSMSEVALGPETKVIGRPSRGAGSSAAIASGTLATICSARTTHTWWSGTSVSARLPDSGPP